MISDDAPPGNAPALAARDVVLSYGRTVVVDGVSLALRRGHVTALIGPNGSGKSTVLRSLARLHALDSGEVRVGDPGGMRDRQLSTFGAREFARRVTLFSQSRPSPQGLTVGEVVAFGRHPYRRGFSGSTAADRSAVDHAMRATGVLEFSARAVGELSGGEMQRVWLACCVAQDTDVILLDEPTNHLDLRHQVDTLDMVRDLAEDGGAAVGIVLHDLDHAAQVADTVVLMCAGRIHAVGSALDVLTASNIETVYGIAVDVALDPRTDRLRIDPVGRHPARTRTTDTPSEFRKVNS